MIRSCTSHEVVSECLPVASASIGGQDLMRVRRRFWFEAALASVTTVLLLITLVRRDWIEAVLGIDPDAYSGSLECMIVGGASRDKLRNVLDDDNEN